MKNSNQSWRFIIAAVTAVLVLIVVLEAGALYKMISMVMRGESPRQLQENGPLEPENLAGEWVQTNPEGEGSYQAIHITAEAIEVYQITDGSCSLYWSGSYTPPPDRKEPYRWISKGDTARMAASPSSTQETEKEFTYAKNKLTYTSEETAVEAERGDWDYAQWTSKLEPAGNRLIESGDIGAYHIEIASLELAADTEGNPAAIITYNWTNNSTATASAMVMLIERAYQGGVQLTSALLDSGYDSDAVSAAVPPGGTKKVQRAFVLTEAGGPVTFEVSEFLSHTNDAVVKEFPLPS